jgi:hypothetical protein
MPEHVEAFIHNCRRRYSSVVRFATLTAGKIIGKYEGGFSE